MDYILYFNYKCTKLTQQIYLFQLLFQHNKQYKYFEEIVVDLIKIMNDNNNKNNNNNNFSKFKRKRDFDNDSLDNIKKLGKSDTEWYELWLDAVLTIANQKCEGVDMKNFILKHIFPPDHTQVEGYLEECHNHVYGSFVNNAMVGMHNIIDETRKDITEEEYISLTEEEKELIEFSAGPVDQDLDEESDLSEFIYTKVTRTFVPQIIQPSFPGDPYVNKRCRVRKSHLKTAEAFEQKWKSAHQVVVSIISKMLDHKFTVLLHKNQDYVKAKENSRCDVMVFIIHKMIFSNSLGYNVVPNVASIAGIRAKQRWNSMVYQPNSDISKHLDLFSIQYEKMRTHGVGLVYNHTEVIIDGVLSLARDEYPAEDYVAGVVLMIQLKDSAYKNYIVSLEEKDQLKAPCCHYEWALSKFREWDEIISQGVNGDKKNNDHMKKNEESYSKKDIAKIAAAIIKGKDNNYNHSNPVSKNKKKQDKQKGKKDEDNIQAFKENFHCYYCKKKGHFPSACPDASKEEKDKAWKKYLAKKELDL